MRSFPTLTFRKRRRKRSGELLPDCVADRGEHVAVVQQSRLTTAAAVPTSCWQFDLQLINTIGVMDAAEGSGQKTTRSIISPPGTRALELARNIFSRKAVQQLEQVVADMREEYFEALSSGAPPLQRAFILIRGYWALIETTGLFQLISFAARIYKFWKKAS